MKEADAISTPTKDINVVIVNLVDWGMGFANL
jgi:hypothetical protein